MLKKNQTHFKYTRPMSNMRVVLSAIEQGYRYKHEIVEETKLYEGKVKSALLNLTFIGAIGLCHDKQGRTYYETPDRFDGVAQCLKGVNSIFNALPEVTVD